MSNTQQEKQGRRKLYPVLDPYIEGMLKVSELHTIAWEISGNPEGKPVVILHGGPGAGRAAFFRGFFNPEIYRIVAFDQRGSGQSTPFACLEENTTAHLISDIEKLREHLSIEKWHTVFGGSWGSTLSLAYSQAHPDRVGHLIVRGIFLVRKSEIDFFYQEGSSWLFPEFHEKFRTMLPQVEQGHILHNYYRRLSRNSSGDEEEKLRFAKAWTTWEKSTSKLIVDEESIKRFQDDKFALAFARIETHYFANGGFFTHEDQLLDDCTKLKNIPTVIIQGRYDIVCPMKSAYDLKQRLNHAEFIVVPDAGHSCAEEGITHELVSATDRYASNE